MADKVLVSIEEDEWYPVAFVQEWEKLEEYEKEFILSSDCIEIPRDVLENFHTTKRLFAEANAQMLAILELDCAKREERRKAAQWEADKPLRVAAQARREEANRQRRERRAARRAERLLAADAAVLH